MRLSLYWTVTLFIVIAGIPRLSAKEKHKPAAPPQDQITVEAHIAVPGGPIARFTPTRHYDRSYVYAERGPGQPVTLLDVTKPAEPRILSQVASSNLASGNLVVVAGTAALSTSAPEAAKPVPQTIRLMDFSNPAAPKVTQEFTGVTAVEKLSNGLIMLADANGIWILSQHLADDPEMDERYARKVIYGESMY
ncbi:MAG TPA: hypothetical protein VHY84_06115 [Bryobacteraceae bacterium]|jgi:hypothetical protein|nr:hypothetical protein [Bryobacteraceae bacterium]